MQIDYLPHYHNHLTLNQTTLNQSPTPLFKWSKFLFRALACKKKYVFWCPKEKPNCGTVNEL